MTGFFRYIALALTGCLFLKGLAFGQAEFPPIPAPSDKHLFNEDVGKIKKEKTKEITRILAEDKPPSAEIDFKADNLNYVKESNLMKGTGHVVASREGLEVQADQGSMNVETKEAELSGDLLVNHSGGIISAQSGKFNLNTEHGEFDDADMIYENGDYHIKAARMLKLTDLDYELYDVKFSTCHCSDDSLPWSISARRSHITQDGFAHTYDTFFNLYGVPVFYSPYFILPAKTERSSGLLAPSLSYNKRDGVGYRQPLFLVLDDSTDVTIAPFLQNHSRNGAFFDYREAFSRRNHASGRFIYSNERPRDGDLRGTLTTDIFDPTFDNDRYGFYYKQTMLPDSEDSVPTTFVSDIHYISDNLFLRELENNEIAPEQSRNVTSSVVLRSLFGESTLAEFAGEYNEALETNQRFVAQRLPEITVTSLRSDRPFGFNPYGIKLVSGIQATGTNFTRTEGYDGLRGDVYPNIRVPYHVQNYFYGAFGAGYRDTYYDLRSQADLVNNRTLDSTENRKLFNFTYTMGTAFERVYNLDQGNSLTYLTSMGSANQDSQLTRVKHTIEPFINYYYIPDVQQDMNPNFDQLDRIRQKSLVLFGLKTSLLGRFLPSSPTAEGISELAPRVEDLPVLREGQALSDLGELDQSADSSYSLRQGSVRELAYLTVKEAYDYIEDTKNLDPNRSPWSDMSTELGLNPTGNVNIILGSSYNLEAHKANYWSLGLNLSDDRGDALRGRYSFLKDSISQLEGNAELVLTDRYKLGYYTRYDDRTSDFIEQKFAVRLASSCNCWYLDLGLHDKINPNKKSVFLTFTLGGLGDLTQGFGYSQAESN